MQTQLRWKLRLTEALLRLAITQRANGCPRTASSARAEPRPPVQGVDDRACAWLAIP
jgi:hypothetical protein